MKKLKTLISVMLCAMLVLSLVVPSMAAEFEITVTGFATQKYDAYKLFDVIYSGEGEDMIAVYKASKTIKEKITALNVAGITFEAVTGETDTFYVTFADNDVAKNLASKLSGVGDTTLKNVWGITPKSATIAAGNTSATIDVGEAGYYFVNTTTGTVCNLTNAVPTAQIEDKNIQPTVEKKVKEGSAWGTNNDGAYGDLVEFETTIRAYKGAESYILHDKMDGNLAFNANSVVVKEGTKTLTKGTDYTIATSELDDDCTFEIVFTAAYLNSVTGTTDSPTIIKVTYNANISTTAVADQEMKNETYLTYGENETETETSTTITKTHDFNLEKTDGGTQQTISGAEFTLKKGDTLVNLVEIKTGNTVTGYRVATSADTTTVTNIKVGLMNIKGLDSGTYTLHEAVTPAGYNTLTEDVTFTIEANGEVKKGSQVQTNDKIVIANNAGTTLPTTGGMGTKILFTVGGIMMVVAFVLFTSKRRMAAED